MYTNSIYATYNDHERLGGSNLGKLQKEKHMTH